MWGNKSNDLSPCLESNATEKLRRSRNKKNKYITQPIFGKSQNIFGN